MWKLSEESKAVLKADVARVLEDFLLDCQTAFGESLRSAVLYGSAAEGRMRNGSDVNLILVLRAFERNAAEAIEAKLNFARAAINLRVMFLREDEIQATADAFAQKFNDILSRRRVIYGPDPFAGLTIPRPALVARLKQVLLNLELRLRERYAESASREDELTPALRDSIGPIRAAALAIRQLQGEPASSGKEALVALAGSLEGGQWKSLPPYFSRLRESTPEAGTLAAKLFETIGLLNAMRKQVENL